MTREEAIALAEKAWTHEQIEAWVNADGEHFWTERRREVARLGRRVLLRRFPEAPDYRALQDKFTAMPEAAMLSRWKDTASDEEVIAKAEELCALLWERSIADNGGDDD